MSRLLRPLFRSAAAWGREAAAPVTAGGVPFSSSVGPEGEPGSSDASAAVARRVNDRLDELRYPVARAKPFAVSGLVRKVAPADREKFEDIFACIDGALHLNYAKFGQSLLALYSPVEPAATKSSHVVSVDTLFPAGFCPVDEILEKSDGMRSSTSTSGEEGLNLPRTKREIIRNRKARADVFRMTSCFVWLARRASFRPVSLQDQRLSEG